MYLSKLLLCLNTEVKALAVLNVVINIRLESSNRIIICCNTISQVWGEISWILGKETINIRIEVGQLCTNQLVEERATQCQREFLTMYKIKSWVATYCRLCTIGARTFSPGKAATFSNPLCLIEIEIYIFILTCNIDVNIFIQVAVGCTDQQIVYEGVLHKLLLGDVPTKGERMRECLTIAFRKTCWVYPCQAYLCKVTTHIVVTCLQA